MNFLKPYLADGADWALSFLLKPDTVGVHLFFFPHALVSRIGLGSLGLVSLTRETAVCSLAAQTHSIQYLQVLPSDEIKACSGFENWSRKV